MTRWILTTVAVLLLAMWLASGQWRAGWPIRFHGEYLTPGFHEGCFVVQHGSRFGRRDGPWIEERNPSWQSIYLRYTLRWLPDVEIHSWAPLPATDHIVYVPLYIPAALTGGLAAFAWRRRLWSQWRRVDACAACGYSLKGLPSAKGGCITCPECGT